jgi:hypothetical protein
LHSLHELSHRVGELLELFEVSPGRHARVEIESVCNAAG